VWRLVDGGGNQLPTASHRDRYTGFVDEVETVDVPAPDALRADPRRRGALIEDEAGP
jgi:hypothetical protein